MASQTRTVNNTVSSAWTAPNNAFSEDNVCTSTATDGAQNVYNFINNAFTIPSGDIIEGITVRTKRGGDADDFYKIELQDTTPAWRLKTGAAYSANCANGASQTLGTSTDLWNGTFTPAHINSSSFQVRLTYTKSGKASTFYVDVVEVTVYHYTPPGIQSKNQLAVAFSQQHRLFRNPRGQKYYYCLVTITDGLFLYKSADAVSTNWSPCTSNLRTSASLVASAEIYDDGSQLVIYVAYAVYRVGSVSSPLFYRCMTIADAATDPSVGSEQTVITPSLGAGAPVIKRDRNGYVHIAYMVGKSYSGYTQAEPRIIATTTINPGDAPSWGSEASIDTHPDISYWSRNARITPAIFGGSGDIGGVVYASRYTDGTIILKARDVVSWNGSSYSLGTVTTIMSSQVSADTDCDVSFRCVVDDNNIAHLLTESSEVSNQLKSMKASAASTVESWNTPVVVTSAAQSRGRKLCLTVDKAPATDRLYAFYSDDGAPNYNLLRWKTSPVDTISWGSENTYSDDTVALLDENSYYQAIESEILITYIRNVSPNYFVRFYKLILVAAAWKKLQYLTEPPTTGAWNKLKFASEPPVPGAWNKLLYEGE